MQKRLNSNFDKISACYEGKTYMWHIYTTDLYELSQYVSYTPPHLKNFLENGNNVIVENKKLYW